LQQNKVPVESGAAKLRQTQLGLYFNPQNPNWSFDYFSCNAAKRPLRGRFAASLIFAPI
jgi:hypothetical protein